jgi:hypothetical protein
MASSEPPSGDKVPLIKRIWQEMHTQQLSKWMIVKLIT